MSGKWVMCDCCGRSVPGSHKFEMGEIVMAGKWRGLVVMICHQCRASIEVRLGQQSSWKPLK